MTRVRAYCAAVAASLLSLACSDSTAPTDTAVTRLRLDPPPGVVALDDTVRLVPRTYDRDGREVAGVAVHWSVAPASATTSPVVTVDSAGLVTARAEGIAIVVATTGRLRDSVAVTVVDAPTTVHLIADTTMLASGATVSYRAVVLGRRGATLSASPVRWTTSDPSAVTVSGGVVSAVAKGSAWITASSGAASDSLQVLVDYVRISGPEPLASVALFTQAFAAHQGCGLTRAGKAYCWGSNQYGQLGAGGGLDFSVTPVAVAGGLTFKELHAGRLAACGLTAADGTLYCWGRNLFAQFGTGSTVPTTSSVPMVGGSGLHFSTMSMSVDGSVCGVSAADAVLYCWGHDTYLTTAKDTAADLTTDSIVAPVTGALKATQVHVFDYHGCAVGVDTAVWCWGSGPTFGQDGTFKAPIMVAEPGRLVSVVVGNFATCGLTAQGYAQCWGYPPVAPTPGPSGYVQGPTPVGGSLKFKKLSIGWYDFACGLTTDGDVYCWGGDGGIGRAGTAPAVEPVPVMPGRKFVDIDQSCAVDVAGDVYCWR